MPCLFGFIFELSPAADRQVGNVEMTMRAGRRDVASTLGSTICACMIKTKVSEHEGGRSQKKVTYSPGTRFHHS